MDFAWTPLQRELYAETLSFAQGLSATLDRKRPRPFGPAEWGAVGRHGLLGLCLARAYGGMELDAVTTARVIEAFGRGCEDFGLVFSACAHLLACAKPIAEHGHDELKDRVLAPLGTGELIGANAITEAEAGSDVFSLKTRYRAEGDEVYLDGVKSYVSNGPVADIFLVYATEDPKWGHMGVSAFVVERDRPGLVVGEPFDKMGLSTSPVSSIYLEECRIPAANRVGGRGAGAKVFSSSMVWERTCLFAGYLGAMERQLERTVEHVRQRRQFGKRLSRHQAVAHRVADMKVRLETARMMLYRACWEKHRDPSKASNLWVSMAKLVVSEAAVQTSLDAIHLHGGLGIVAECGLERDLRDAIPSRIFSGTSEIQRDLIAAGMGL
ncbi:MAG: acyl-CoA dehydrogenase family protein [Myxococcota bacterium]